MYLWKLQLAMSTNWDARSHLIWIWIQNRNVSPFCFDSLTFFSIFVVIVVESILHRNSNGKYYSVVSVILCMYFALWHWTETEHFILWNFIFQWKYVCCTFNIKYVDDSIRFSLWIFNNKNGVSLTIHDHVLNIKCKILMDFHFYAMQYAIW